MDMDVLLSQSFLFGSATKQSGTECSALSHRRRRSPPPGSAAAAPPPKKNNNNKKTITKKKAIGEMMALLPWPTSPLSRAFLVLAWGQSGLQARRLLGGNDQYQSRAVSLAFGNEPSFIHSIHRTILFGTAISGS